MPRTLVESKITTREARAKLSAVVLDKKGKLKRDKKGKPMSALYWRGLDPDVHLGYRKQGKHYGIWVVRWRKPGDEAGRGYLQAPLGTADDVIAEDTLDYPAACKKARETVEQARAEARAAAAGIIATVGSVVRHYLAERDARVSGRAGRALRSDASTRLECYLIGRAARAGRAAIEPAKLASVPLHALGEDDLKRWRRDLPAKLRETTKRRTANDLRAALNAAVDDMPGKTPEQTSAKARLRTVIEDGLKNGKGHGAGATETGVRENQILTDAQVARVLQVAREVEPERWGDDLFRLLLVLAATGARYSQVIRMHVDNVQVKERRLLVPSSFKGNSGEARPPIPVPVGADVIAALLPIVTGRKGGEVLLLRWHLKQAPGSIRWARDTRGPWRDPAELGRVWREHIRPRARLGAEIDAYALRHTSIVNALKAGLPVQLVAKLHDTSVKMIEAHYAHWIVSALDELAAKAVRPLLPASAGKVVALRERQR